MAADWDGKSRGTVLGFKIFIFFIRNFGITASYALMHLPVPYFCLFSGKNVRALFYYFRKRQGYSFFKTCISIYKCYYVFGQTLIDKVAIPSGYREKYTYHFDGEEQIKELMARKRGGLLISAHVGNFELAQYFFNNLDPEANISIVITDLDHQKIKEYLEQFKRNEHINFIVVKEDMSHIFKINAALAQNRIVCISGDRYVKNAKWLEADLLGKKAKFPLGPFKLATRLKVPVLFVYVMREPNRHYHLYARKVAIEHNASQHLLEKFAAHLELVVKKYPLQWFNFYDFWDTLKK